MKHIQMNGKVLRSEQQLAVAFKSKHGAHATIKHDLDVMKDAIKENDLFDWLAQGIKLDKGKTTIFRKDKALECLREIMPEEEIQSKFFYKKEKKSVSIPKE